MCGSVLAAQPFATLRLFAGLFAIAAPARFAATELMRLVGAAPVRLAAVAPLVRFAAAAPVRFADAAVARFAGVVAVVRRDAATPPAAAVFFAFFAAALVRFGVARFAATFFAVVVFAAVVFAAVAFFTVVAFFTAAAPVRLVRRVAATRFAAVAFSTPVVFFVGRDVLVATDLATAFFVGRAAVVVAFFAGVALRAAAGFRAGDVFFAAAAPFAGAAFFAGAVSRAAVFFLAGTAFVAAVALRGPAVFFAGAERVVVERVAVGFFAGFALAPLSAAVFAAVVCFVVTRFATVLVVAFFNSAIASPLSSLLAEPAGVLLVPRGVALRHPVQGPLRLSDGRVGPEKVSFRAHIVGRLHAVVPQAPVVPGVLSADAAHDATPPRSAPCDTTELHSWFTRRRSLMGSLCTAGSAAATNSPEMTRQLHYGRHSGQHSGHCGRSASEPVNQQLVDQPPVDRRAAGDYRCLRIRYVSVAASMRRRLREPGPIARRARPYR